MKQTRRILTGVGLALLLAGCDETSGGPMEAPVVAAPSPVVASLPPGAACTAEIDRYQTVVKADLATGNVEQKVYDQIETELTRAAAACAQGQGGQSHSIVAASKARHGYRA